MTNELLSPGPGFIGGSPRCRVSLDDDQIIARRLPEERPHDPADYAAAVRHEHQRLRHQAHYKLMQAFLDPEIFDGHVTATRQPQTARGRQLRLVTDDPAA